MSESRRELERLIDGIDEEISDARRDIKEAEADAATTIRCCRRTVLLGNYFAGANR